MIESKKINSNIKVLGIIVLSALIRAVGVSLFMLPNRIIVGGVLGIAGILQLCFPEAFIFQASLWLVFLNLPLLIISFFKLGKVWTLRTTANVFCTAIFMFLIDYFNLANLLDTVTQSNKVLYAIIGGVMFGCALPMMLSIQGSTGGTDILALLFGRKSSTNVMRSILAVAVITIFAGTFILQDINVFVFSLVSLFCSEMVEEQIYRGYSSAICLEVITERPVEVANAFMTELHHGVTSIDIMGMYSLTNKTQIICVMNKRQVTHARKLLRSIDTGAFAYILPVHEVVGRGFVNKEIELEEAKDVLPIVKSSRPKAVKEPKAKQNNNIEKQ